MDSKSILLVDDEPELLELLKEELEHAGFVCSTAPEGESAWQMLNANKNKFDLVITDLNMPRMNGLELIEKIRLNNMSLPVFIFLTMESIDKQKIKKLTINRILEKPINFKNLLKDIKEVA